MNKRISFGLRFLVSAGLIALLLYWLVDLKAAWQALKDANWGYLLLAAAWFLGDRFLMSYKWRLLLTCRGVAVGLSESFLAYLLATFSGYFLPSTVGADAMRVAAVSGSGRSSQVVTASVAMERGLGFLASAVAGFLSLFLMVAFYTSLPTKAVLWAAGLLLVVLLGLVAALYSPLGRWLESLPAKLEGRGRIMKWLGGFLAAFALYRLHGGVLVFFTFLSLLEQGAPVVGTWLAAKALSLDVSILQTAAVVPLANLFARVPIGVSTLGMVEGLYVAFFSLVGVDATSAFLMGLFMSLAVMFTSLPGSLVYLSKGRLWAKKIADPAPGPAGNQ